MRCRGQHSELFGLKLVCTPFWVELDLRTLTQTLDVTDFETESHGYPVEFVRLSLQDSVLFPGRWSIVTGPGLDSVSRPEGEDGDN